MIHGMMGWIVACALIPGACGAICTFVLLFCLLLPDSRIAKWILGPYPD